MSQQDCPITTISTISIAGLILKHIQGLVSSSAGIVGVAPLKFIQIQLIQLLLFPTAMILL